MNEEETIVYYRRLNQKHSRYLLRCSFNSLTLLIGCMMLFFTRTTWILGIMTLIASGAWLDKTDPRKKGGGGEGKDFTKVYEERK